jgi:hypothetical protein
MDDTFEGSDKPIIPSVKFPPLIDPKNGLNAFNEAPNIGNKLAAFNIIELIAPTRSVGHLDNTLDRIRSRWAKNQGIIRMRKRSTRSSRERYLRTASPVERRSCGQGRATDGVPLPRQRGRFRPCAVSIASSRQSGRLIQLLLGVNDAAKVVNAVTRVAGEWNHDSFIV